MWQTMSSESIRAGPFQATSERLFGFPTRKRCNMNGITRLIEPLNTRLVGLAPPAWTNLPSSISKQNVRKKSYVINRGGSPDAFPRKWKYYFFFVPAG